VGVTLVVLISVAGAPAGTPAGLTAGWNTAALAGAALAAVGAVAVVLIRPTADHAATTVTPSAAAMPE
jgi:hypothetical protein